MENVKVKPPKVRHSDGRADRLVVRTVVAPFVAEMTKEFERRVRTKTFGTGPTGALLLKARKKLVLLVRAGMHERADLEVEIAVQAMIVWWLRQAKEDRDRMLEREGWA